jgi:hypothetical protein
MKITPQEILTLDGPSTLLEAPKEEQEGTKDTEDFASVKAFAQEDSILCM